MELKNEIHRLNTLHRLIKLCNTGSPDELAHKLHISKRHLYNVLDDLRALGAKIDYSHSNYTFYSLIWIKIAMKVKFKAENKITLMF